MEVLNHLNSILTFDSYDELKESVAHYQRTNFVQLYKRDARTIEAMKKRAPNKNYQENRMYSCIKYCCIHGGKNHKPIFILKFKHVFLLSI